MTDATRETIKQWRDAALLQVAAESYFQNADLRDAEQVAVRLARGNTPLDNNEPSQQQFIRMAGQGQASSQALDFLSRYEIVDQHVNDATGFSATVVRDKGTGELTIAFRSTEYANPRAGQLAGDYYRDGFYAADGEVSRNGFAFGQILAMRRYYEQPKQGITALDPATGTPNFQHAARHAQ